MAPQSCITRVPATPKLLTFLAIVCWSLDSDFEGLVNFMSFLTLVDLWVPGAYHPLSFL